MISDMGKYAIIKDNAVVNMVMWDGEGDLFSEFATLEVSDTDSVRIGDAVVKGTVYPKPDDGFEYVFDGDKLVWSLTEAGEKEKTQAAVIENEGMKEALINSAKETISLWQTELILGSISDDDKASLTQWVAYIKLLQAVDTSSPSVTWPKSPE